MYSPLNQLLKDQSDYEAVHDSYYNGLKPGNYRSGAIAGCPVQAALNAAGAAGDPADKRFAQYGEAIHDKIQLMASEWSVRTGDSERVLVEAKTTRMYRADEFGFDGIYASRNDLVIWLDGEIHVYELKTQNPYALAKAHDLPYAWHLRQADIAFENLRFAIVHGLPITSRDYLGNKQAFRSCTVRPEMRWPMVQHIGYIPREVSKTSNGWLTHDIPFTEEQVHERLRRDGEYYSEWGRLFEKAFDKKPAGMILSGVESMKSQYDIPNEKKNCGWCNVQRFCPLLNTEGYETFRGGQ